MMPFTASHFSACDALANVHLMEVKLWSLTDVLQPFDMGIVEWKQNVINLGSSQSNTCSTFWWMRQTNWSNPKASCELLHVVEFLFSLFSAESQRQLSSFSSPVCLSCTYSDVVTCVMGVGVVAVGLFRWTLFSYWDDCGSGGTATVWFDPPSLVRNCLLEPDAEP